MFDKVHSALQEALDEVGIEIPNNALDVHLKTDEPGTGRSAKDN